jgi:uncharacterized membrane protein
MVDENHKEQFAYELYEANPAHVGTWLWLTLDLCVSVCMDRLYGWKFFVVVVLVYFLTGSIANIADKNHKVEFAFSEDFWSAAGMGYSLYDLIF